MGGYAITGSLEVEPETRREEARLSLRLQANVDQAGGQTNAEVLNLSRTGLLLRTEYALALNEPLSVVLPGLEPWPAEIAWSSANLFGCRFERPLRRPDLARLELADRPAPTGSIEPLGARIKRMREQAGLTMIGLGRAVGVSKPTVWKWETGRAVPRSDAFSRLCTTLRMSEMEMAYGRADYLDVSMGRDRPASSAPSLAEVISSSRRAIARSADVDEESIVILIET